MAKDKHAKSFLGHLIDTVIDGIRQEIIDKSYKIKPIKYKVKIDGNTGKARNIGIQDIKQQLYDYIAVYALRELFEAKIGYYQCSALERKGIIFGVYSIEKWVNNHHIRYAIQSDIRHFYESIDTDILKSMLRRDVKNDAILDLVFFLIDSFKTGLSIGSYLSQFLACYYLSPAYHYVTEECYKIRKHKDGTKERVRLINHAAWYADDCVLLGTSLKDVKKAHKMYVKFCKEKLHVEVKPDIKIVDLQTGYIDIMGYKISRKNVTIRSSNFIRIRRNLKRVASYPEDYIPLHEARSFSSRSGALKHSDSKHFIKRSGADVIEERCNLTISRKSKRR
jgi:hypothetical protein